ncbi:MAG: LysR family transcriptional regulator [Acidimicrobiales bacterium]
MMQEHPPLLPLTIQQLHYLATVAEQPTWAAAATELGVSPSALSQGLAELERRIGVTLFTRSGRRRELAPGADEVVAYAQRVIAQTRELGQWAASVRSGSAGRLRVGMIDAAAVEHFPGALAAFRAERPDVDLRLTVAPSGTLLEQLRAAELDVAVVVDPPPPSDDLELSPSSRKTSPLRSGRCSGRRCAELGTVRVVPRGLHTRRTIVAALHERGATVDVVAVSHQPEVLRTMVELGLGWTVLPVAQAESGPRHSAGRSRSRSVADGSSQRGAGARSPSRQPRH